MRGARYQKNGQRRILGGIDANGQARRLENAGWVQVYPLEYNGERLEKPREPKELSDQEEIGLQSLAVSLEPTPKPKRTRKKASE